MPKIVVRERMKMGAGNFLGGYGRLGREAKSGHPPRPPFCLTIGLVGHRPDRLPLEGQPRVIAQIDATFALLAKTARSVSERYGQFFTEGSPALRVISALAEGADQIGARGGLENGFSLTAVLPFAVEDYRRDFKQQSSKKEFERLLGQADTTTVLPGCRDLEAAAYETAGLMIVDNSDLLLAVWDGEGPAGWGGR